MNWKTLFNNKTVNKQVSIFSETIINIVSNFVPNKRVTFDDSNPPWMNNYIKNKIKLKHEMYKTDFVAKANHFINFFASQCTPLNNNSKIPQNQTYKTNTKLSLLKFKNKDIINIIRSLNEDKVHAMIIYPSEC